MKAALFVALVAGALAVSPSRRADDAVYTANTKFPAKGFNDFYFYPNGHEQEPRPKVERVDGKGAFPDHVANPWAAPFRPPSNEAIYPKKKKSGNKEKLVKNAFNIGHQLFGKGKDNGPTCKLCRSGLATLKELVLIDPELLPSVVEDLCQSFNLASLYGIANQCAGVLGRNNYGAIAAQVLAYGDFDGDSYDGQNFCSLAGLCEHPDYKLSEDFLNKWFGGSRHVPDDVKARWEKKASKPAGKKGGRRELRVPHLSDIHVDPRYLVGSEANCQMGDTIQCCRINSRNYGKYAGPVAWGHVKPWMIDQPANYWGAYMCDTPWSLVGASLEAMEHLQGDGYDLALFTGDITAHDDLQHYSRDFVLYSQQAVMDTLKAHLGDTTLLTTLGNHDSSPENIYAPHNLPDGRGNQFSWDSEYVAKLWQSKGWLDNDAADQVREHYGGYSISPRKGLRVISLNTDFWYKYNFLNYIHSSNPDPSGILRFLTDELFAAEKAGERVWIIGHVLTGWSGSEALDNPSNLFYQIVSRFAPHTIAHIFFGHTHEDQFQVFYRNDNGDAATADRSTPHAVSNAFVAPSITTYQKLNPTFRIYKVDEETYDVLDFDQYYTDVSGFDHLTSSNADHGPVWRHLFNARAAYGNFGKSQDAGKYSAPVKLDNGWWPESAPLNGSFWSAVADEVSVNPDLMYRFSENQSRKSPKAKKCTSDECRKENECYMRSGTSFQGRNCGSQFSTVA